MQNLITQHLDIWTAAQAPKNNVGRGRKKNGNGQTQYGIKKLRELILDLAVRGKLVPQDPDDEPASVLLEKIAKEKARLIKDGKIKKQKKLHAIAEDEKPFELPDGWKWERLQNISTYIQRGKSPKYSDEGRVRVVSQKCIQWSGFDLSKSRFINDKTIETYQTERFLENKDLLWNSTGTGTVGRVNVVFEIERNQLVADSHVTVIRPLQISSMYLWCFVASPEIQLRINPENEKSLVSGTTKQVELNTSVVQALLIPTPPLAEQNRIVAKVDELMTLCDQLEQQQEDTAGTHQTLVENVLYTLTKATDHDEFIAAWQRISNHFDTLFTTEQSIDHLKQTILQLAVMGKLVPQDPNDETTSVLLEKIAKEKVRLIKEGKIKKQKKLPEITEDEIPFELPDGWARASLSHLGVFAGGKTPSKAKSIYWDGDIPWVTPKDMKVKDIHDTMDHVTAKAVEEGLTLYDSEAILFVVRSGILKHTLPVAITKTNCTVNQDLKVLSLFRKDLSNYVHLMMKGYEQYILEHLTKRGMTVESVKFDEFSKHYFMLPPLSEQHRIVAKVDDLMALCDKLKSRINEAQTIQNQLADTIIEQAVV